MPESVTGAKRLLLLMSLTATGAAVAEDQLDLLDLSIEELAEVRISLASKSPEPLSGIASAAHVLTSDEIHRAGAMNLPEALRLAPNLQVAQVNSHDWAITARGFNGAPLANNSLANKLLVMIDGRSVYTPLFGGVFWDVQSVSLEDLDRIEVISGPGGTLWGSNAVNGIINVVSRSAAQTQGLRVSTSVGDFLEHTAFLRYGGEIDSDAHYRVYMQTAARGPAELAGTPAADEWRYSQIGFRFDLAPSPRDALTIQGDLYDGAEGAPTATEVDGDNVLARWTRELERGSRLSFQAYYDRTARFLPGQLFGVDVQTVDFDVQHTVSLDAGKTLIWGAGHRAMRDEVRNAPGLSFDPASSDMELSSAFVQIDLPVLERLALTLGTKIERNDFSGTEVQPRVQVSFAPSDTRTLWAAVSRAVRSPSRFDVDETTPFVTTPAPFDAESLLAYEIGYRIRPTSALALSVAAFYNDYDDLRSLSFNTQAPPVFAFTNDQVATTRGIEISADFQATPRWRLRGGFNYLDESFAAVDPLVIPGAAEFEALDPRRQLSLHSMLDPTARLSIDLTARYVDELPVLFDEVPSYFAVDVRLAWRNDRWELAAVARNAFDSSHREFGAAEIPRGIFGTVTWQL